MFYGTKFFYKLFYFITAMSPAYFLFLLQLNHKFKDEIKLVILQRECDVYHLCILLLSVVVILTIFLKFLLKRQFNKAQGNFLLNTELQDFHVSQIEDSNGSVISFLLGTVIPAVLIIETSLSEAVMVFIILQIIIFILINRSSEIFPNIMLIIFGVDICKMVNGKYLLVLKGNDREIKKVIQVGTPSKSKLFITSYKK